MRKSFEREPSFFEMWPSCLYKKTVCGASQKMMLVQKSLLGAPLKRVPVQKSWLGAYVILPKGQKSAPNRLFCTAR